MMAAQIANSATVVEFYNPDLDNFFITADPNEQSFEGRDLIQRVGTIVRLNQKTATVSCNGLEWRVSFALLRHVIDL